MMLKSLPFFGLGVVLICLSKLGRGVVDTPSYDGRGSSHPIARGDGEGRTPKLADGCRHVFLDVGSNLGVHVRMLLEPHLYPDSRHPRIIRKQGNRTARAFFASQFGPEDARDNAEVCAFGFEPNPAHIPRHREMEAAYRAVGWRYQFVHAGVADEEGDLTFYHIGRGDKELERGFTTVKSRCHQECRPENVTVLRLSDWIDNEVHGRIVSSATSNDDRSVLEPPRVVVKMDIEMGEWLVLPDLITSGVLCRDVDAVLMEFHLRQHKDDYPIHFPGRGNWTLKTYQEAQVLKEEMVGMIERNPHCRTNIVEGDDESYGSDGMPWPQPLAAKS